MIRILAIASIALLFNACKKQDSGTTTVDPATGNQTDMEIDLIHPADGSYLDSGVTVDFQVYISDKLSLHEYAFRLNHGDSLFFDEEGHTHTYEYNFNKTWTNNCEKGDTLHLQVVTTNHKGELLEEVYCFISR
ncbi:MAG: hypothetical protein GC180_04935 [Bacteroidetes bacterium]|nr:hypothetical protein [Bacteroidota bacterium]